MILAEGYWHGNEYIPEIVDDPWANLERVAQVLGRKRERSSGMCRCLYALCKVSLSSPRPPDQSGHYSAEAVCRLDKPHS
jgi:hypothetical protein